MWTENCAQHSAHWLAAALSATHTTSSLRPGYTFTLIYVWKINVLASGITQPFILPGWLPTSSLCTIHFKKGWTSTTSVRYLSKSLSLSLALSHLFSFFWGGTAGASILITLTATNANNQSTCLARLSISRDSQVCPKACWFVRATTVFRTKNRMQFSSSTSVEYESYIFRTTGWSQTTSFTD